MIYYPNKIERYTSALRLLYQRFIIKTGVKYNYMVSLRKIYEFEATFRNTELPLNIEGFCSEIFTAVIFKKKFDYFINTRKNYILNKKLFTVLLLNLCLLTDYLEIKEINQRLTIIGKFATDKKIKKTVRKLGGNILKDIKNNKVIISFSLTATSKESEDFEKAYYLIQNPLSIVNLYLID